MQADSVNGTTGAKRHYETILTELYEKHYDRITHYVYSRIGNKAEAEDLAGEVFLKALESLKSYKERGVPMQAWLFRIAHNLVVDHLRKMTKRKTVDIDTVNIASGINPEIVAEKNIEFEQVTQAMEQLSPAQKEIIRLRFLGGLTSKEVGSVLNKSDGAVREAQRSAIEKLRKILSVV